MFSPNKQQEFPWAKEFYCVNGDGCRAKGANYWDRSGPAGGPESLDVSAQQVRDYDNKLTEFWGVSDEYNGGISKGLHTL
jgi:hypothetical protein